MTLTIAHRENGRVILDAVRERRPPFSPSDVVAEFGATLQNYGVGSVTGDRYGGEWPASASTLQSSQERISSQPSPPSSNLR